MRDGFEPTGSALKTPKKPNVLAKAIKRPDAAPVASKPEPVAAKVAVKVAEVTQAEPVKVKETTPAAPAPVISLPPVSDAY